ncbi:hypothetical protein A0H81_08390 [Grifola frondosa]|uniref:Uncharacterized protein n=1 Tax=Grifola frondosa TaxID=5627 RepID=A0A1C7M301_GRIFR|nr:hypothetical protein A0H81_08390 [Grifola frondosa]
MGLRRQDNGIQARRERARHKARDPASMLIEAAKLHERPPAWAARVPAVPEFCRKRDGDSAREIKPSISKSILVFGLREVEH